MLIATSQNRNSLHGVVGHRGAAARAPENTMAAFRQAYADGADAIELDILKTKDGRFLVMHDDTVDRTTNGTGRVADQNLAELQKLDAGSWFDAKFADERPPELGEVLDWAKDKINVVIEVKRKTAAQSSGAELVEIVRDKGMSEQVTVMSFNHEFVERVEALAPDLDTGVLCAPYKAYKTAGVGTALGLAGGLTAGLLASGNPLVTAATTIAGAIGGGLVGRYLGMGAARATAETTTADNLMPNWFITTRGLVDRAERNGKGVVPYTVDNALVAAKVRANGVNGLITNEPHSYAEPRANGRGRE